MYIGMGLEVYNMATILFAQTGTLPLGHSGKIGWGFGAFSLSRTAFLFRDVCYSLILWKTLCSV